MTRSKATISFDCQSKGLVRCFRGQFLSILVFVLSVGNLEKLLFYTLLNTPQRLAESYSSLALAFFPFKCIQKVQLSSIMAGNDSHRFFPSFSGDNGDQPADRRLPRPSDSRRHAQGLGRVEGEDSPGASPVRGGLQIDQYSALTSDQEASVVTYRQ